MWVSAYRDIDPEPIYRTALCHMDYFNDVLTKFLCLDHGSTLAVYGGSESSRISSKLS